MPQLLIAAVAAVAMVAMPAPSLAAHRSTRSSSPKKHHRPSRRCRANRRRRCPTRRPKPAAGRPGPARPPGVHGAPGPAGALGAAGIPGVGTQGATGSTGSQGQAGPAGVAGAVLRVSAYAHVAADGTFDPNTGAGITSGELWRAGTGVYCGGDLNAAPFAVTATVDSTLAAIATVHIGLNTACDAAANPPKPGGTTQVTVRTFDASGTPTDEAWGLLILSPPPPTP